MIESADGMRVSRIRVSELARNTPIGRGLWQFNCARAFTQAALEENSPEIALVYSPPLPLGLSALALRGRRGIPFVLNVQDLFPQAAIDLGVMRNRLLIRGFERLETHLYRKADAITVHSRGNREHVLGRGGRPETTFVMHNSVDVEAIRPGPRANSLRRELGLDGQFVASFGGIMGFSQDLDVILEAAHRLRERREITFLLVGDGVEKERCVRKSAELGLHNVIWMPMLNRERYPQLLEASDLCLTTLRARVKTPVVPSKILSAMAGGRPVVAMVDPDGDAPKLIAEAGAGTSLPPEDAGALAAAVLRLAHDPDLCRRMGESGRKYAEEHLSAGAVAAEYERIFRDVLEQRSRAQATVRGRSSGPRDG